MALGMPASAATGDQAAVRSELTKIVSDLDSGVVDRIELLYIPYTNIYRTRVSPDIMLRNRENSVGYVILSGPDLKILSSLLGKISVWPTTKLADCRWGLLFFDRLGNGHHTIFLSTRYIDPDLVFGYIDGATVQFDTSLSRWLETRVPEANAP